MSAVFINPQLIVQQNDKFTTGIIYMPLTLAYVVSSFKNKKINTKVIDLYGENPTKCLKSENSLIFGNGIDDVDQTELETAKCFVLKVQNLV